MDLIRKLEEYRAQEQALAWEGTFADYFEIVKQQPQVAQLSHARVFNMIMSEGVEVGKRGETRWTISRHTAEMAMEAIAEPRPALPAAKSSGKSRRRKRRKRLL